MPTDTLFHGEDGELRVVVLRFEEIELHDGRIHPSWISVEVRIWGPPVLGLKLNEAKTLHRLLGEALEAAKSRTVDVGKEDS